MKKIFKRTLIIAAAAVAIWIVLSVIFMWPPFCSIYRGDSADSCINKLRQIHGLKLQYMEDTGQTNGEVDFASLVAKYQGNYFVTPRCPGGGTYTPGRFDEDPVCSLATSPIPAGVKVPVGSFGWRWKVWPTSRASHILSLGFLHVADEAGKPVPGAEIVIRYPETNFAGYRTATDGSAYVSPISHGGIPPWPDRTSVIIVTKAGFRDQAVTNPVRWPVQITLKKSD